MSDEKKSSEKEISLDVSASRPDPSPKAQAKAQPAPDLKKNATPADIIDFLVGQDADNILPWEDCVLPSMGVYYDGRIPDGKIKVRPMGITADKIMATPRLAQSGQALDYVYKEHIRFPDKDFDPQELLVGDRTYVLFYLRAITHGNIYEFAVQCTNEACNIMSTHEYDLNKIEANKRGPQYPKEPVRVKLPYLTELAGGNEVWVEIRFLRGHDIQTINKRRRFMARAVGKAVRSAKSGESVSSDQVVLDKSLEENLHLVIQNVNGVTDQRKISEIMKRMSQRDTQAVRRVLNEGAPGIDTDIIVTCPECNNEMRMDLPVTDTFFRPEVGTTMRE
jgi:hypothetical protein